MIYIQILGPSEKNNLLFVEKIAHPRFSKLNDFHITTDMEFDPRALKNYLILTNDTDYEIKIKWIEYYYANSIMELVTEI